MDIRALDLDHDTSRVILDSLADGIYITDANRNILFWNKSAERLTGWPASEIVGHSCFDDILAHQDIAGNPLCGKELCPLHRAIAYGQSSTLPVIVFAKRRDGQRIPVEVTVAPVRDAQGDIIGGIESFRDLTPLMQDLERARLIQEHAMRAPLPEDSRITVAIHSVPMEFVSGDFARVESLNADTYAVLLADVTGHGVASALYAMQIRSLWEEARDLLRDPTAFAAHMNEKLFELTKEDDCFATAFYGLIDLRDHTLSYIRAGHTAPFLIRESALIELDSCAPALGLLPQADFPAHCERLEPGDAMLLYTDGAVEVRNPLEEELGEDGLCTMLMRETGGCVDRPALRRLEETLLAYAGRIGFEDDVTLLGITVR